MIARSVHHVSPSIRDLVRSRAFCEDVLAANEAIGRMSLPDPAGDGIQRIVPGAR